MIYSKWFNDIYLGFMKCLIECDRTQMMYSKYVLFYTISLDHQAKLVP